MPDLRILRSLYVQVLVAVVAGALIGHLWPETGVALKPLGDGFIRLIKMLIGPIVFCTVVLGISGMEDLKKVGRTGGLALLYFEVVSTIALVIGLVVVNVVRPGAGMHVDPATLDTSAVAQYTSQAQQAGGFADHVLNVIPTTIIGAFASGDVLQVLLFSVLFGFALHAVGGRALALYAMIEQLSSALFRIVGWIMRLAPIGALGAMAFTIGKYGVGALLSLGKLMACFYLTCLLFVFVVLGSIARAAGFSLWRFLRYIREELFIVLGTSSSDSVLPRMMSRLESLGATLVEIDFESVSEWARAHSVSYTTYESLVTNQEIYGLIEKEVEKGNNLLGRVEQVKAFRILDRELDPEMEGEAVTATRKIKRSLLHKHFGHLIDQMYSDDEETRIARQMKQ